MIDVIGFWTSVTLLIGLPVWFWGYRITRWVLSIAKANAPEIPRELRSENRYIRSRYDWHLYPQWAHNLNYAFGGGRMDTGAVLVLGALASIPTLILVAGFFSDKCTMVSLIADVAQATATVTGWLAIGLSSTVGLYMAVCKGSRLIGLVQIQEMKENKRD